MSVNLRTSVGTYEFPQPISRAECVFEANRSNECENEDVSVEILASSDSVSSSDEAMEADDESGWWCRRHVFAVDLRFANLHSGNRSHLLIRCRRTQHFAHLDTVNAW